MEVLPFVGVAAVVIVTPGVDMALVARNALVHGRSAGLATAIVVNLGVTAWSVAAAAGVAAVVRTSASVFLTLKLLGAAYLIYLGVQACVAARHRWEKEQRRGRRQRVKRCARAS